MRKLLLSLVVATMVLSPLAASADDVDDGKDCRATGERGPVVPDGDGRGSTCVATGGVIILYVGGEAGSESSGTACGAIIVASTGPAEDSERLPAPAGFLAVGAHGVTVGTENWDTTDEGGTAHCD